MPDPRAKSKQMSRRYHYAALTHWSVALPLMMGGALAVFSVPLALALVFLGELGVLGVLPRIGSFRARVDAYCERCEAAVLRAGLLGRMSAAHRAELERIERLALAIRKRCGRGESGHAAPSAVAVERWLELERLVALYVQIAIAHFDVTASFPAEEHAALIVATEQMRATSLARGGATDTCLQRRSAILHKRREIWAQAANERDFLVQELSSIVDLVHWMHELCAVAQGSSVRLETERGLASWEPSGDTLREVSTLCCSDGQAVDPVSLALGRDELAKRAEMSRRLEASRQVWENGRASDGLPRVAVALAPATLTSSSVGQRV